MINKHEYLNKKIQRISDIIKIKVKNSYVFLINIKLITISIGKINEKLLFIPICLLAYKNRRLLEEEKNLLFSNTIIDYLRLRKCSETSKNMQTLIKDKKNEEIGHVKVLEVDGFISKENTLDNKNNKLKELNEKINILEPKNKEKSDEINNLKKIKYNNNESENDRDNHRIIYNKRPQRFQKSPEKLEEELQKSNEKNRKLEEDLKEKDNEIHKLRNKSQDYKICRTSQFTKNINKNEIDDTKFPLVC